jgi:hypothetical protein
MWKQQKTDAGVVHNLTLAKLKEEWERQVETVEEPLPYQLWMTTKRKWTDKEADNDEKLDDDDDDNDNDCKGSA